MPNTNKHIAAIIGFSILLLFAVFALGYTAAQCEDNTVKFGQILFPNAFHSDTLIVTDPGFFNEKIKTDGAKIDGSNSDILCATCFVYHTGAHYCNNANCPYNEETVFTSKYDEGTDSYYLDLTHFQHPLWSNEACEDYVFNTNELN